jgi:hypothetical protein
MNTTADNLALMELITTLKSALGTASRLSDVQVSEVLADQLFAYVLEKRSARPVHVEILVHCNEKCVVHTATRTPPTDG